MGLAAGVRSGKRRPGGSGAGVAALGDTWATRASATAPGQPVPSPCGRQRTRSPGAARRAGLLTEQQHEQPGRRSGAPPSHAGAAAGAAVRRAPGRRGAAGTERDTGAPRPLRSAEARGRLGRPGLAGRRGHHQPPQPLPPAAPASSSLAGAPHRLPTRRAVSRATAAPARRLAATGKTYTKHGCRVQPTCSGPHELCKDRLDLKPKASSLRSNLSFSAALFKQSPL